MRFSKQEALKNFLTDALTKHLLWILT